MTRVLPGIVLAVTVAASTVACDRAETATSPQGATRVDGAERLQWDQAGPSLDVVKSYRYVAVIGRRPSDLKNVNCAAKASGDGFTCTSELPEMARGVHQLWVVAVATDDKRVLVSRWDAPLTLDKQ